jgi:hypothetical protein
MATERVGDMTLAELRAFIKETVEELQDEQEPYNDLSVDEINAIVDEHIWTPPPGSRSVVELIREDRDR